MSKPLLDWDQISEVIDCDALLYLCSIWYPEISSHTLTVFGRPVHVPWASGGVCKFSFSELCDQVRPFMNDHERADPDHILPLVSWACRLPDVGLKVSYLGDH